MRTMLRSKATLLFVFVAALIAVPAVVAIADTITADPVVNTVVVDNNVSTAAGGTGTVKVWLDNDDNTTDPVNGCNAATGTPVSVTLSSTNSDIVFDSSGTKANPTSLTACGSANGKEIGYSVKSTATGPFPKTAGVTASGSGGRTSTSGGTTNQPSYTPDTFTVIITAPADTTPPVINSTLNPANADGANGWYKGNVSLTWSVTDAQSAVTKTGCVDQNITSDQQDTSYTCSATSAGGSSGPVSVSIKRDATNPTDIQWSGGPNDQGSYAFGNVPNAPTCTATDATSGMDTCVVTDYSNAVGTHTMTATATDKAGNKTTATRTYTVKKADPVVSWDAPADITYGTALGPDQLNATADVDGTFDYDPAAGTKLDAGTHTLSVQFTPDSTNYNPASKTVSITVNKADPVITWTAPADITYGAALGNAQLNAQSDVAGSFDYTPAAGTVLDAGTHTLKADFTPTNTNNYNSASKTVQLKVNKADPVITWTAPTAIAYGTALSATQLNATADVAGSFTYTPAVGTVLLAGNQTLSVQFTPTNTNNYNNASKTVTLVVNPYPFTGFFQPVDNNGVFNTAKAGSAIPIKFSLGSNKGLNIIAAGYPKVTAVACPKAMTADLIEETVTTTSNSFNYDATANQYNYVWKTQSAYATKCYRFDLQLIDGTTHSALFNFTR